MRRLLPGACALLAAALALPAPAVRADDPTPPTADAHGMPLSATDSAGNKVWYRYDANGVLREERYSDGRVVRHEDHRATSSSTGVGLAIEPAERPAPP
ncbi:MAG TPA: RHS repeat domain-containing protein [Myxococcota bacterium]|nr:RHS repeat domain-containing protein [Myxococcota bacterium]